MDMEQEDLVQDNLMPHLQGVNPPASPHPNDEQVPSDKGDTEILGYQPEGEMHNISFDKYQHRVFQSRRLSTLEDHTSPTQYEE